MAAVVWFTMGVAIWHFTVFVPDRFRGGIVGAFLAASAGAMVTGAIFQIASGRSIGETDVLTALVAIPGTLIALAMDWYSGDRAEQSLSLGTLLHVSAPPPPQGVLPEQRDPLPRLLRRRPVGHGLDSRCLRSHR